jgi:uncharacterized protein YpmB
MKNQIIIIIMMIIIIIQFFIICVPNQQLQGQLQTQHSTDTGNHIKGKHNLKTKDKLQTNTGERERINIEKVNKQNKDEEKYIKNVTSKNYVTKDIRFMKKYY